MILKCVARLHPEDSVRYRHFELGTNELSSGSYTFLEKPGERNYRVLLPVGCDDFRAFKFDLAVQPDIQAHTSSEPDTWTVGFAYWYDLNRQEMQLVVTSGSMFLMSDQGDTIDKLR